MGIHPFSQFCSIIIERSKKGGCVDQVQYTTFSDFGVNQTVLWWNFPGPGRKRGKCKVSKHNGQQQPSGGWNLWRWRGDLWGWRQRRWNSSEYFNRLTSHFQNSQNSKDKNADVSGIAPDKKNAVRVTNFNQKIVIINGQKSVNNVLLTSLPHPKRGTFIMISLCNSKDVNSRYIINSNNKKEPQIQELQRFIDQPSSWFVGDNVQNGKNELVFFDCKMAACSLELLLILCSFWSKCLNPIERR